MFRLCMWSVVEVEARTEDKDTLEFLVLWGVFFVGRGLEGGR